MILVTVFAVSIDAYAAGMSLASYGRMGERTLLYIASYSFILPLLLVCVADIAAGEARWLNTAGACIIIILGLRGMLPGKRPGARLLDACGQNGPGFSRATLLGISLAADTSAGAAALQADVPFFVVPALTFAAHYLLLSLGRRTARLFGASRAAGIAASAVLVALGFYRLIG